MASMLFQVSFMVVALLVFEALFAAYVGMFAYAVL